MPKLTQKKVKWIIRQKERQQDDPAITNQSIAWAQDVTVRRVQQLWKEYRDTGDIPELHEPGRPSKPIPDDEVDRILRAHDETGLGACHLERYIRRHDGTHIPHNRIHKVLKDHDRAQDEPAKQKRRKYVRYERPHSLDLLHTDWKQLPNDDWFLAFQDDASRYVLSWGQFPRRSGEQSVALLDQAVDGFGVPLAVVTDQGSEFYAGPQKDKRQGVSRFTRRLTGLGVRHITSRRNHPQTNGKVERIYGEVEKRWGRFEGDVDAIVDWHNHVKPHRSLRFDRGETPGEAFWRKLPPERVLDRIGSWFWLEGD